MSAARKSGARRPSTRKSSSTRSARKASSSRRSTGHDWATLVQVKELVGRLERLDQSFRSQRDADANTTTAAEPIRPVQGDGRAIIRGREEKTAIKGTPTTAGSDSSDKPDGAIDIAALRVRASTNLVVSATTRLRRRVEDLRGPIPEAAGSKGDPSEGPVLHGSVNQLEQHLEWLAQEVEALHGMLDRLNGL